MKITTNESRVAASEIVEINAANVGELREPLLRALCGGRIREVEIDLSTTRFIDSSGLGGLVAVQLQATQNGGTVRLLSPQPQILKILKLTQLDRMFEIVAS